MDKHQHTHSCGCDGDHGHDHAHHHANNDSLVLSWAISVGLVLILFLFLKPFIIEQMFFRITSYSTYSSPEDVVRISNKILFLDSKNVKALTSKGAAYMDQKEYEQAIEVLEKVRQLNPSDKGFATYLLGKAMFMKQNYLKAIEYFEAIRSSGQSARATLEADMLKYRHGIATLRNMDGMGVMLAMLSESYQKTGDNQRSEAISNEIKSNAAKFKRRIF